jgi:hypothetical protein
MPIEAIPYNIDTTFFGNKELIKSVHIPKIIYDDYRYGCSLIKAGGVTIGVGIACCLGGLISYKLAKSKDNMSALITGNILIGVGGSFISASIPLFSCGAFHKWHSNHDLNLYCL